MINRLDFVDLLKTRAKYQKNKLTTKLTYFIQNYDHYRKLVRDNANIQASQTPLNNLPRLFLMLTKESNAAFLPYCDLFYCHCLHL